MQRKCSESSSYKRQDITPEMKVSQDPELFCDRDTDINGDSFNKVCVVPLSIE